MNTSALIMLALYLAILVMAYSLFLMTVVFVVGQYTRVRHRRQSVIAEKWRHIISRAIVENTDNFPTLSRTQTEIFLMVWLHFQELVKGPAREKLNTIATQVGLLQKALLFLKSPNRKKKLFAILALGHLREQRAVDELARLAFKDDVLLMRLLKTKGSK